MKLVKFFLLYAVSVTEAKQQTGVTCKDSVKFNKRLGWFHEHTCIW